MFFTKYLLISANSIVDISDLLFHLLILIAIHYTYYIHSFAIYRLPVICRFRKQRTQLYAAGISEF